MGYINNGIGNTSVQGALEGPTHKTNGYKV